MTSTFTITTEQGRIDKVITAHETTHTRSQVQKWLQDGLVTVNGQPTKANYKVASGDVIAISIPEAKPLEAIPEPIPLDIVYEDDLVIQMAHWSTVCYIILICRASTVSFVPASCIASTRTPADY